MSYEGEVVSIIVYILNRCHTKKLVNKAPHEVWLGRKPSVKHMKIFCSLYFKHVPDAIRRNLEDKRNRMVLVGFITQEPIGYLVLTQSK